MESRCRSSGYRTSHRGWGRSRWSGNYRLIPKGTIEEKNQELQGVWFFPRSFRWVQGACRGLSLAEIRENFGNFWSRKNEAPIRYNEVLRKEVQKWNKDRFPLVSQMMRSCWQKYDHERTMSQSTCCVKVITATRTGFGMVSPSIGEKPWISPVWLWGQSRAQNLKVENGAQIGSEEGVRIWRRNTQPSIWLRMLVIPERHNGSTCSSRKQPTAPFQKENPVELLRVVTWASLTIS